MPPCGQIQPRMHFFSMYNFYPLTPSSLTPINNAPPIIKRMINPNTPFKELPVIWVMTPSKVVPIIDENFPKTL